MKKKLGDQLKAERAEKQRAAGDQLQMFNEAAIGMTFKGLCENFLRLVKDRPDLDPGVTEELGNQLGRLAWESERG